MLRSAQALFLLASLGGTCPGAVAPGPEAAYASFARAVQHGEGDEAFAQLSSSSQSALTERAHAAARATGGAAPEDPTQLLFTSPLRAAPITEVKLVSAQGSTAVVHAVSASGAADVKMVREQGSWRVDLTDALH